MLSNEIRRVSVQESVGMASGHDPAPFPLIDLNLAVALSDCEIKVSRQEFAFAFCS